MSGSDSRPASKVGRVALISLGCPKNQVDSELILGRLAADGAEIVEDIEDADTIVVNTCSFIDRAREESVEALLAAEEWKEARAGRSVIAAGCLVQRSSKELAQELPSIDAFVGLDEIGVSTRSVRAARSHTPLVELPVLPSGPAQALFDHRDPRHRLSPPWTAFVKIAEGCDQSCAFCAIPGFRGRMRSRALDDLGAELSQLAAEGVLEANLIAQDSTGYGRDLGMQDGLAALLETFEELPEAPPWIRLHYLYPGRISGRLVEVLSSARRIVPYIDLPLQHADSEILKAMRRPGHAQSYLRQLETLRRAMPGAGVRSAFIVGFPGETDAAFERLKEFVEAARFDSLGIFTYSHEEGTPAWGLADDVSAELKEERRAELEELFLATAHELNDGRVGEELEVLVEGRAEDDPSVLTGRFKGQAPEVDGRVLLRGNDALPAGCFVRARIVAAAPLELVGEWLPGEGAA